MTQETTKCPHLCSCLAPGLSSNHRVYTVKTTPYKDRMFDKPKNNEVPHCPNILSCGYQVICNCPTHYALTQQHLRGRIE